MTTSPTLLNFLNELDEIIAERDALRQKVAELEAKRFDNRPKLSRGDVANIRDLRRAGHKLQEIADVYDVNTTTISRIVRGEYHK